MTSSATEGGDRVPESETPSPGDGQTDPQSPPLPVHGGNGGNPDERDQRRTPTTVGGSDPDAAGAIPAAALKVIGSIVAPTTLLTALLFYFGALYAVGYYRYFGVNFTVLDLPVHGLLILSASTAIMPLALIVIATLLALWLYELPLQRLSGRLLQVVRIGITGAVAVISLAMLALTAADAVLAFRIYPDTFGEARGISLAAGVLGLIYAAHLRRSLETASTPEEAHRSPPQAVVIARWGSRFLLVSVGLFWAVGSYAINVGATDAQGLAADLACTANVTLYSEKSLNLGSAGVREEPAASTDSAYGFRYPDLKLIPQAGQQYLLVPADWSPSVRPAILLARAESLRLEFLTPLQQRLGSC